MTACTIIGLGEAGATYATALIAAGHSVTGLDPVAPSTPAGVTRAATAPRRALAQTLSWSSPERPQPAVRPRNACPFCRRAAAMPTSPRPPARHAGLGQLPSPALFVDVAILGPVAALGEKTPLMVSGPGSGPLPISWRRLVPRSKSPTASPGPRWPTNCSAAS